MKICSLCNRIYADETNFCLDDGNTLSFYHSPNPSQDVNVPSVFADESPTVVRQSEIKKSQKPKQISPFMRYIVIGISILFILATIYTMSVIPLGFGIILVTLLIGSAKVYTTIQKN